MTLSPERMTDLTRARLGLALAAVLWSLSSFFIRLLTTPTWFKLEEPKLSSLHVAIFRSLFSGLALLLIVKRKDMHFRPAMIAMVICFSTMTGLYLTALNEGAAANAILLQNTAPVWVALFGWLILKEVTDRRTLVSVGVAMIGGAVIVLGNWPKEGGSQASILMMAAGSGVMYATVILFLRYLRDESAPWLITLNLTGTAVVVGTVLLIAKGPSEFATWITTPTVKQLVFLGLFGIIQMATPYVLFSRGLKVIGPTEAGIITLLEPLLNPVWAFLITPETDTPTPWTLIGGGILLTAMVLRYVRRSSG